MRFKIRSMNDSNIPLWRKKEAEYDSFVESLRGKVPDDLWCYFGTDFFHDGWINSLEVCNKFGSIKMNIDCPNIRYEKDGSFEFANLSFDVTFRNVAYFNMECRNMKNRSDPFEFGDDEIKYYLGEINTLTEKIRVAKNSWGEEFYSLIIDTFPGIRMISIVFEDICVCPVEPLAYAIICNDKNYVVPTRS